MRATVKEWLIRGGLVLASTLVALLAAEVIVRSLYPISDGRDNVTLDGRKIAEWFEPGVYRQVSNEYDAVTTITPKRHRVPGADGNPEVIFLGDSFTFGWGLADNDSFAAIYCASLRKSCANLARPGTGTANQLDRLEQFLNDFGWKPVEVKLFFFGMSSSFSAGNDFVDNYYEGRSRLATIKALATDPPRQPASATQPAHEPGWAERLISFQSLILGHSNLARVAKYHFGPLLKSLLLAKPGQDRMDEAVRFTAQSLRRLDELSRLHNFRYSIYLIVPVHDVIRDTYADTLALLNTASPIPAIPTGQLFVDNPASFYFAYDGHLNVAGSRRLAEFLISRDSAAEPAHAIAEGK